jgi:signal transduction histidine kinase
MVSVAILDIRAQHRTAIDAQRHTLTQLSRVLAEDTSRYASVVDLALRDVQSRIAELGIVSPEQFRYDLAGEAIFSLLRARVRDLSQASAIALIDATGRMVNSSRAWPPPTLDAHDRDFFQYFATHDDPAPYLGAVERSRVTDALTLFMARRIDGPHGEFLGVVVGALDIGDLTGRYQAVLTQSGESITLLRRDGLVLARYPNGDTAVGQGLPPESAWYGVVAAGGGTYSSPGYLGPGPLIVSAIPVSGYGMVVDFTIAESAALEGWRHQAIVTAAAVLAASIGVIALFGVIAAQFRRLQRAAEALRAGERRIRDFAETGSDWFWEQDADPRFSWISVDLPVRRPEDQSYIGQTRWERAGADPADASWAAHNADLAARRPFRDFRYHRLGRDGRELHLSISGNPVYDDAGRFIGYRGTGRDVTARMQAQEELREAKEQAEAASRVKSEFLATMTHELRTPLSAIIGFSELIRDQPFGGAGAQYAEYAREINASGHQLLAVINDVLELSKIEAGRYELSDEPVDLGEVLRSSHAPLISRAAEAQVRLICAAEPGGEPGRATGGPSKGPSGGGPPAGSPEGSPEGPREGSPARLPEATIVRADPRAVRQVVQNVLDNAVKFTPAGGTVTACIEATGGGDLAVVVTDTGIGIDPMALRHLFEPFRQADSSITRRFGGSGLGLAISRRLMLLHGGMLTVDSTPGKGTDVRIIFPRQRVLATPGGLDHTSPVGGRRSA